MVSLLCGATVPLIYKKLATARVKKAQCKVKFYQHDLNNLYRNISVTNMINVLILSLCKNKNIQKYQDGISSVKVLKQTCSRFIILQA